MALLLRKTTVEESVRQSTQLGYCTHPAKSFVDAFEPRARRWPSCHFAECEYKDGCATTGIRHKRQEPLTVTRNALKPPVARLLSETQAQQALGSRSTRKHVSNNAEMSRDLAYLPEFHISVESRHGEDCPDVVSISQVDSMPRLLAKFAHVVSPVLQRDSVSHTLAQKW